ncbi:MAG: sigma 54-dependent Fis family transcriptional regulator [Deltaproteobacteria bacterium]|nr:sigma 54-dependent Fis family transcriptional regulator [Deltaproteobacteria bacterium]
MHRIEWSYGSDQGSCFSADGLLHLPIHVAEAKEKYSVALMPRHALLLSNEGAQLLPAGECTNTEGLSLTWHPSTYIHYKTDVSDFNSDTITIKKEPPNLLTTPQGQKYTIGDTPFLIGRHHSCNLSLNDTQASLFHCALLRVDNGIRVIDMASAKGTLIDSVRIQQAIIIHRAIITVGRTRLLLAKDDTISLLAKLPSKPMQNLREQIKRVAPTNLPVLITGESGTGKDIVANEIHATSGRNGPMICINAATVSPSLAASELFGHVRGAFTGADRNHMGAFMRAHRGTLFLDEIAELSLSVQAELLRAVELGRIQRLGETQETEVDVRIVAASHRDLAARVRANAFREDLYHRLCVFPIIVPPLRERRSDIDAITEQFFATQASQFHLSLAARNKLIRHDWQGNVRELLNTLRRACAFAKTYRIEGTDIKFLPPLSKNSELDDVIIQRVLKTFDRTDSVAITAQKLGIRRSTVHRILNNRRRAQRQGTIIKFDSIDDDA